MQVADRASIFETVAGDDEHATSASDVAATTGAPRRHHPFTPRAQSVCFAVFSLLIILLDLVRRRVVHCTRLRPPHPPLRAPNRRARCITRANSQIAFIATNIIVAWILASKRRLFEHYSKSGKDLLYLQLVKWIHHKVLSQWRTFMYQSAIFF